MHRVINLNYTNFTKHLGLTSKGPGLSVAKSPDYDKIHFVMSISKFVAMVYQSYWNIIKRIMS